MANDHNAINLSQGFPDFPSDSLLTKYVHEAMQEGYNQYAPMEGDLLLRKTISEKVRSLYGKRYDPNTEITITAGATQAIFTTIAATIRENDEVIVFSPAYDCYEPAIELFGGISVPIQLHPPMYAPNWEEVANSINSRTKMIIVNTPHNPSGAIFSEEDMNQLQELTEANNLWVISDEVYEHIIFNGHLHQSAARFESLSKRTFITASFGKTFHNTGWKMGYCLAPELLMKEFQKVHQYNVFSVNHPAQKGLARYLQNKEHYLRLPQFFQQKRDFFLDLLKDSRFKILPSNGTYFQLLDFSNISDESDITFAEKLTKDHGVATIPTSVFNKEQEDFSQIRVCFAKKEETLKAAASILNII